MNHFILPDHLKEYQCCIELRDIDLRFPKIAWKALVLLRSRIDALNLAQKLHISKEDAYAFIDQFVSYGLVKEATNANISFNDFNEDITLNPSLFSEPSDKDLPTESNPSESDYVLGEDGLIIIQSSYQSADEGEVLLEFG